MLQDHLRKSDNINGIHHPGVIKRSYFIIKVIFLLYTIIVIIINGMFPEMKYKKAIFTAYSVRVVEIDDSIYLELFIFQHIQNNSCHHFLVIA